MKGLLEERIGWFGPQLNAVGRRVRLSASNLPSVAADRNRVGQVLNILLENYLRYASSGGDLSIQVSVTHGNMVIEFEDRGPGLTEDELNRVFQRFWRQESSRARRAGGSGLGLSIAQAICTAHGGTITALRPDRGGMLFSVSLPL
ncbi:sensor histidine kinase [Pseudomonas sp. BGr12]|uniref:sensor histidine kinase n=1 Tax=Pseudomonas sp. BGr12 TaxID=2936269 RepID=UPI0033369581